jgi:hypothetical protein
LIENLCLASIRNPETGEHEACLHPLLGDIRITDEGDFLKTFSTCTAGHSSVSYLRKVERVH